MKPASMSNIDWFIKKLALSNNVSEITTKAVINHQYEFLIENMKKNDTLELVGFGKFFFNRKKAERKLIKHINYRNVCEKNSIDESKSEAIRLKSKDSVIAYTKMINELKTRIYENQSEEYIRGLEESLVTR